MRSNHRRTSAPRRDLGRRRPGRHADRNQKLPSQTHSTASSPAGKKAKRETPLSNGNGGTYHRVPRRLMRRADESPTVLSPPHQHSTHQLLSSPAIAATVPLSH